MATTQFDVPEGLPFVDYTREFDAPADLIHRAYTDPELIPQWLGPRASRWTSRSGSPGTAARGATSRPIPTAGTWGFHGVFHGPQTADQMIQTFEFEGVPGHVSISELKIEDLGNGRSRATTHVVFMSLADRDGMVQSGMEFGVVQGFERLDELAASLAPVA